MGTISQTATCMYTKHTPGTQTPGGLRVYTRQHAHMLRGTCVNTNAHVRGHARRGTARHTCRSTHAGRLCPWTPRLSCPYSAAPMDGGGAGAGLIQLCPGPGVLFPARRLTVRPGREAAPPWPLPKQKCEPRHPHRPGASGGDSGPQWGQTTPPAHPARAVFPRAA